jgi:hypothetical protein
MGYARILDKDIYPKNYGSFKHCRIDNQGKTITFVMACGASYSVPLKYFLKWNTYPHYVLRKGRLRPWDGAPTPSHEGIVSFSRCRRTLSNTAVNVYLSNGSVYQVPWDTVLMACEEKYEHFGGLTEESKRIVTGWFAGHRKNRCHP